MVGTHIRAHGKIIQIGGCSTLLCYFFKNKIQIIGNRQNIQSVFLKHIFLIYFGKYEHPVHLKRILVCAKAFPSKNLKSRTVSKL